MTTPWADELEVLAPAEDSVDANVEPFRIVVGSPTRGVPVDKHALAGQHSGRRAYNAANALGTHVYSSLLVLHSVIF